MNKKPAKLIKLEIVSSVWGYAKDSYNIQKELNSNWLTIKKYVDELVKEGILEEVLINGKPAGYKVKQIIKDIVIHSYEPRDLIDLNNFIKINKKQVKKWEDEI